jgi:hypothetical protein
MWYSDAEINFVSSAAEYYGDIDGFVPHSGGDWAVCNSYSLLVPRQLAARQISHALHRLPCSSTNANVFARSTLPQITIIAVIVCRLSMIIIVNVSQPFFRAKPNHDTAIFFFVDGEWVLGFLVGEYLALVDEVIIFTISPCASDPCRCPCQIGQRVLLVARVGLAAKRHWGLHGFQLFVELRQLLAPSAFRVQ